MGSDFFISYTSVDDPWAQWIAVELEAAGYSTVLQAWDFTPGTDFLHEMHKAAKSAQRTVAVLSLTTSARRSARQSGGRRSLRIPVES
ncbi:hypothetical protein GCM10027615_30660 [Plantactinospora veratri]